MMAIIVFLGKVCVMFAIPRESVKDDCNENLFWLILSQCNLLVMAAIVVLGNVFVMAAIPRECFFFFYWIHP